MLPRCRMKVRSSVVCLVIILAAAFLSLVDIGGNFGNISQRRAGLVVANTAQTVNALGTTNLDTVPENPSQLEVAQIRVDRQQAPHNIVVDDGLRSKIRNTSKILDGGGCNTTRLEQILDEIQMFGQHDASTSSLANTLSIYSSCMNTLRSPKDWGKHVPLEVRKPHERVMCRKGRHYFGPQYLNQTGRHGAVHEYWHAAFKSLILHLQHDCDKVYTYNLHVPKWLPDLWRFGEKGDYIPNTLRTLDLVSKSPRWKTWFSTAVRWSAVGAPQRIRLEGAQGGGLIVSSYGVSKSRILDIMLISFRLSHLNSFKRIVDFGGGTTIVARIIFLGGFTGEYMIYDFFPMCVLQEYILRISNIPALLVPPGGTTVRMLSGVTLTPSQDKMKSQIQLGASEGGRSLLYASYSLSEAPIEVREAFLGNVVDTFTDFFIVFAVVGNPKWVSNSTKGDRFGGNFAYFRNATRAGRFGKDSSFCIWRNQFQSAMFLVASKVAKVQCEPAAGCTRQTLIRCQ